MIKLHPHYDLEEMRRVRKPPVQGVRRFLERFHEHEVFGINIPVTSKCNFHCDFCYFKELHNTFPSFPPEVFQKVLDNLEAIHGSVPVDCIGISYTGGEPTCDLDCLEMLTNMARPYTQHAFGRYATTLITNGQYGKSSEDIKRIDAMGIDAAYISLSENHFKEQNIEDLVRIAKESRMKIGATCIAKAPNNDVLKELYKDFFPYICENTFLLEQACKWDKLAYLPSSHYISKPLSNDGIAVYPDGTIGTLCIGGGTKYSCKLGTVDNIIEICENLHGSWTQINFWLKPIGEIEKNAFSPICPHLRNLGISACCADRAEFDVVMTADREIVAINRAEYDILA